jgi:uncharacterized protein YsxB (DUF464 family)
MIKITFFKNNQFLIGFEISGHSGYATEGSDIVCAAVSSMAQMTVVGLTHVNNFKLNVKKDSKKGYLLCKFSKNASENDIKNAQNFLNSLKISLEDVEKDYKKYIKMEVKDEIY